LILSKRVAKNKAAFFFVIIITNHFLIINDIQKIFSCSGKAIESRIPFLWHPAVSNVQPGETAVAPA